MGDSATALAGMASLGQTTVGRLRPLAAPGLVVLLCAALGMASGLPALLQAAMAVTAAIAVGVVCIRAPGYAVVVVVAWLSVQSMIRRMLLGAGAGGDRDVLLLVAPAAVGLLVVVAARRGAFGSPTPLARGVLVLTALIALSAFNPLQGGPTVGLAGLLFVLIPPLWFWIGRAVVDDRILNLLLRVVVVLAIAAAGYGLFQVFRGFPSWDQDWIATKKFVSLQVGGGALRQFASFASTTEYVGFLATALLVLAVRKRALGSVALAAAIIALLAWAISLASVRSVIVLLPVALGITAAAKRGMSPLKAIGAGLVGLAVLGFIVSTLDPGSVGGDRTGRLIERQIEGLADPFNPQVSTLPIHLQQLTIGLTRAFQNPIGQGVGSVTIAARTFGGNTFGTEMDPSNVGVAMGLPGLVAYLFVVVAGFRLAFRAVARDRSFLPVVAVGVLILTAAQWLNGGNYAIAPFPWLMLGWLDRRATAAREHEQAEALLRA